MTHNFETEIAKDVGVNAAVILHNIYFWCAKNRANGENYHDGLYWTFNSVKAFSELFPYLSTQSIRTAIDKLVASGYIVTGNFNGQAFNRTTWYAVTQKTILVYEYREMDLLKSTNTFVNSNKAITDNKHQIINTDIEVCDRPQKFIPPKVEEVKAYCRERNNGIDAERFVSFYEAKGWMIGKNKMKDWQAAVRSWEKDTADRYKPKEQELSFDPKAIELRAIMETPDL